MAKNNKQCFEFDRTDRLRRTIFLEDSSEDELFEYNNKTKIREDSWNKPPTSLIKPKTKVKVGGRADSLPISIKQVKVIKKRKPLVDRLTTVKASNVKPKEVEPNIIKIENNKQVINNASTKTKRQV
ncbi:uncharacterized protein LOC114127863 [Aphis gossypii]|uniref:Uncharacterized protein n=1 Tax=Aphis gossypii TaxID=80765 RepID=A0A9P0NN10_APHGO|nr:uncharacterized protein LOC114127863 [Aphis gossypii]CAH1733092.1 unnamed protein product [Aphis gossypii]